MGPWLIARHSALNPHTPGHGSTPCTLRLIPLLLDENAKYGITSSEEVFEEYEVKDKTPAVVLFKKFDEGKNVLEGDISEESVATFVSANYLPLVVDFTSEQLP
eukprot:TRINITY_DN23235_c0_g1_i1.p3 TRINITY_DN23235_c0_g1~~TRINITY_DN23235_c0_g1_i1.p3  ORF type:complete len:104 (+),score=29.15 TRINITY_DN23235_c0_g1_i1:160-471(+)